MKVTLTSAVTREHVEIDIEFRPIPVLPTGTVINRPIQGGLYIYEIEWTPNEAVAALLRNNKKPVPAKLQKGRAYKDEQVGEYVQFDSHKLKVRIAGKPDLAELWHWVRDATTAENDAREKYWAAERDGSRAALLADIPAGSVAVKCIGSAPDPWEAGLSVGLWQSEDGRTFDGSPDKQANGVGYIRDEELTRISAFYAERKAKAAAREKDKAEALARREAEIKATVVPPEALVAYREYRGDDEKAWEESDEGSWALIRQYRDAIEAQGLAFPSAAVLRREFPPEPIEPE